MSFSPMADLEIVGGAATRVRLLRRPLDDIDGKSLARVALSGNGDAAATDVGPSAGNVIELDGSQHRGGAGPARQATSARIQPRAVALAVRAADVLVAASAGIIAYRLQPRLVWPPDPAAAFTALAVMAMLLRLPGAEPRLLHDAMRRALRRHLADAALRTVLPFACSALVLIALVPAGDVLRKGLMDWLALWALGTVTGGAAVRLCLAGAIAQWRRRGRLRQAVAIFGTGDLAERLLARLRLSSPDAIELVGVFDDRARRRITNPALRTLAVGTADDLVALSRHRDIDRVLVALPHSAERRIVDVLQKLRRMPVEISLAPDLVGYNLPCREADELSGLPLVEVYGRPLTFGQSLLKSALDKVLAVLALVLGAPLLLAIAAAIKLDSKGPVLFRQNRYGFGDRLIGVFKFRTMTVDATDYDGVRQAQPNDPRVTRVGRFLRRWSLDELPQLINVLHSEMSLVGPRPHAVSMRVEEMPTHDIVPDYAMRHHVKPGITGWAQVNGYHGPIVTAEALHARVRYDLEYINNWSLWFDVQIMLRTFRIVFSATRTDAALARRKRLAAARGVRGYSSPAATGRPASGD